MKKNREQYDPKDLKAYMALPAKQKLLFLERSRIFFLKATPPKNKKAWGQLKSKGW